MFFNSITHQFLAPLEPTTLPESSATWSIDRWYPPPLSSIFDHDANILHSLSTFDHQSQSPAGSRFRLEQSNALLLSGNGRQFPETKFLWRSCFLQPSRWNTTSNEWSQLRLPGSRAICNLMHTMYSGGLNGSNMSWNDPTGRIPIPKFETLDKSHLQKKTVRNKKQFTLPGLYCKYELQTCMISWPSQVCEENLYPHEKPKKIPAKIHVQRSKCRMKNAMKQTLWRYQQQSTTITIITKKDMQRFNFSKSILAKKHFQTSRVLIYMSFFSLQKSMKILYLPGTITETHPLPVPMLVEGVKPRTTSNNNIPSNSVCDVSDFWCLPGCSLPFFSFTWWANLRFRKDDLMKTSGDEVVNPAIRKVWNVT